MTVTGCVISQPCLEAPSHICSMLLLFCLGDCQLSTAAILLIVNETADCCSLIKKGVFALERFRVGELYRQRGNEGAREGGG